jgi:hypothetical protein
MVLERETKEEQMSTAFRQAVEGKDLQAMEAALAPDVVFSSPAVFKRYEGREATMGLLRLVTTVFEDFRYIDELESSGSAALVFEARVGDRELQGIDYLRLNDEGLVSELMVLIRPLSGLNALAEAMGALLAQPSEV